MKKTIKLSKYFSNNISIRSAFNSVLSKIDYSNEILFDFQNINFMSRSCADEYIKIKELHPKIIEINLSPEIEAMLKSVALGRNSLNSESEKKGVSCYC